MNSDPIRRGSRVEAKVQVVARAAIAAIGGAGVLAVLVAALVPTASLILGRASLPAVCYLLAARIRYFEFTLAVEFIRSAVGTVADAFISIRPIPLTGPIPAFSGSTSATVTGGIRV